MDMRDREKQPEAAADRSISALFERYSQDAFRVANAILQRDEDAEDVVQDLFVRILERHLPTVRDLPSEEDVRGYLLTAAHNLALNAFSRRERMGLVQADEATELKSLEAPDRFFEKICLESDMELLIRVIRGLDEPYRSILYYRFVLELKPSEIADLISGKPDTVRKQIIRGRKLLLEALGKRKEKMNYE